MISQVEPFEVGRIERIHALRSLFGAGSERDTLAPVVEALQKKVQARRRGLTYVVELSAWSRDPAKAARIANTFAEL